MSQPTLTLIAKIYQNFIGNMECAEYNTTVRMVKTIAGELKIEVSELIEFNN